MIWSRAEFSWLSFNLQRKSSETTFTQWQFSLAPKILLVANILGRAYVLRHIFIFQIVTKVMFSFRKREFCQIIMLCEIYLYLSKPKCQLRIMLLSGLEKAQLQLQLQLFLFFCFVFVCETESHYASQAALELPTFLSQSSKSWDNRHEPFTQLCGSLI